MKKIYLGVGINAYQDAPLRGCVNDIESLSSRLIKQYGFETGDNMRVVTDGRAKRDNIVHRLKWLIHKAKGGDLAVIQYSGHGSQVPIRAGDDGEVDGLDEILCPVDLDFDGVFIRDNFLGEVIEELSGNGVFVVFLSDSCHSGTIARSPVVSETPKFLPLPFDFKFRLKPGIPVRGRNKSNPGIVISGCQDNQTSADAWIGSKYSGAMTWALCSILDEKPKITYRELGNLLPQFVKQAGFEQTPQVTGDEDALARVVFN